MGRRLRRSSLAALALFVLLLAGAAIFMYSRRDWTAERVAGLITRNLLSGRGYALSMEGLRWRFPNRLELDGIRLSYQGGLRPPFDLFEARRLEITFDPLSIIRGDFQSSRLVLADATLRAFRIESKGWAYPGFDPRPGKRSDVELDLGLAEIDTLRILRERPAAGDSLGGLPGGPAAIDTLWVDHTRFSLYRNRSGSTLDLEELSLRESALPALRLKGRFFLGADSRLTLAGVRLELPHSSLDARGHIDLGRGRAFRLELESDSLRLAEAAALLNRKITGESWLSGPLTLAGRPDSLHLLGRMSGRIENYELSGLDLAGLYDDGILRLDTLRGRLNGNAIDGDALIKLPGAGRSLSFDATSRLDSFDLAPFLEDELHSALNGRGRIQLVGEELRFDLDLGPGSFDIYSFQSARGELRLVGDSLVFMPLLLEDQGLHLEVSGSLEPKRRRVDLWGEGQSRSSRLAGFFAGDPKLAGDLDFSMGYSGDLDHPAFSLDGVFRDVNYLETDIAEGWLAITADSLLITPFDIHVEAARIARSGFSFDTLLLDADLLGKSLRIRNATLDGEPLALMVAGRFELGLNSAQGDLDRLWLRWLGEDWLNDGNVPLNVGEHPGIGPAAWTSRKGRVEVDWSGKAEDAKRLTLRGLDLSQLAPWLPDKLGVSGSLDGELTGLPDESYGMSARISRVALDSLGAGELDLALRWRGEDLAVDSLSWRMESRKSMSLRGNVTGLPDAGRGLGELARLDADSLALHLQLTALGFPVESLDRLRAKPWGLQGQLSGTLRLDGPLAAPVLGAGARLDSFQLGTISLDRIEGSGSYEAGRAVLSQLSIIRGNSRLDGSIKFPVELSLTAPLHLSPDGALAGELHLDARAEDLLALSEFLAEASGSLTGEIRLGGSVGTPVAEGGLRLRSGGLRLAGWEESLEGLDADAVIRGDTLELLSFHAREGQKWSRNRVGELSGDGWLTWHGPFRYAGRVRLKNASIATIPFFTGVVSGEFAIRTWEEVGVPPHPYISGSGQIHQGILSYDFQNPKAAAATTTTPVLSYELSIRADNNLMLINNEADLELSGEIMLRRTPGVDEITGELRTLRGSYTVFGNRFQIIEGFLDFSSAEGINPKIDILAETRTRDDRIQIRISNTFAEPQVDVVSEQGYSREDVLRILMGLPAGGEMGGNRDQAQALVKSRVEGELVGRLERLVSGELAGLVDFELENRNLEGVGEQETRWQIGRYLPGGLYVSYNQGLSLDSDRELGLEYRLYNRLYLRSEVINHGSQLWEGGLYNEYNLDIRLRYDY